MLAKSLIASTEMEHQVNNWLKKNCYTKENTDDDFGTKLLGYGYWHGFFGHNGHFLYVKKGQEFPLDWDIWSNG